jgi:hypothetical protein
LPRFKALPVGGPGAAAVDSLCVRCAAPVHERWTQPIDGRREAMLPLAAKFSANKNQAYVLHLFDITQYKCLIWRVA